MVLDVQVFDVIWLCERQFFGTRICKILILSKFVFYAYKILCLFKSISYQILDHRVIKGHTHSIVDGGIGQTKKALAEISRLATADPN